MEKRYQFISAVHLFLFKQEKVLLLRRFQTGFEDGNYSVPAGHIDQGESAKSAMVREAEEETGIKIDKKELQMIHVMHRLGNDHERIDFFMTAEKWLGEPEICEKDKCDKLIWAEVDQLPENMVPYILSALKAVKAGRFYSEFGWS
jgi:ADP-ribose pyrophosphatase YjhB (NUDIX family)